MPEYLAPGTDPTWPLQTQPNQFVGGVVQGNGPYPASTPNRTEYYAAISGAAGYPAQMVWDHARNCCTISERMINPIDIMVGAPNLWCKGYTGKGIKICVFDYPYDASRLSHQSVSVSGSYSTYPVDNYTNTQLLHAIQAISTIAGRNSGNSRIVGPAYDAEIYSAAGEIAPAIEWARTLGCSIFVISDEFSVNAGILEQARLFHKEGGIIVISAGNSGTLTQIQECCAIPDAVSVGTTLGGTVLTFQDAFYTKSVLPRGNKQLDYVLPSHTIVPGFDTNPPVGGEGADNLYRVNAGSSFGHRVAGYLAQLKQRYPRMSGIQADKAMKFRARKVVIEGITTYVPNLSKFR